MTEKEIIEVLDQILSAMDKVSNRDEDSLTQYQSELKRLLKKLPAATYAAIKNPEIKNKVESIWHRTFAKYQGCIRGNKPQLGGINLECKQLMIDHDFYVDCDFRNERSIFHELYTVLNKSQLESVFIALFRMGVLQATIAKNFSNIFVHLEKDLEKALKRPKTKFSHLKIQYKKKFILNFADNLKKYGLEHRFSGDIRKLLGVKHAGVISPRPLKPVVLDITEPEPKPVSPKSVFMDTMRPKSALQKLFEPDEVLRTVTSALSPLSFSSALLNRKFDWDSIFANDDEALAELSELQETKRQRLEETKRPRLEGM